MSTLDHPSGGLPLDPQSEANELTHISARAVTATPRAAVPWDHLDAMWAAEMERRERQAACPAGYRDAPCEACGTALYVPIGQGGDVLCDACRVAGDAAAAAADDDPRPPTSGALHPDYPEFAASAARLLKDQLCEGIGVADEEPATPHLENAEQQQALVDALSAEVVRRLSGLVGSRDRERHQDGRVGSVPSGVSARRTA